MITMMMMTMMIMIMLMIMGTIVVVVVVVDVVGQCNFPATWNTGDTTTGCFNTTKGFGSTVWPTDGKSEKLSKT